MRVNFKTLLLIGSFGAALHGCSSMGNFSADPMAGYASAQELILKKNINQPDGAAKEYVYEWGARHQGADPESLLPRKYLSQYCHAKGGSFSLLHKSSLGLVKDGRARNALASSRNVSQGIGAYQCKQRNGQRWIVSIEPIAEMRSAQYADARAVRLHAQIMDADEAQRFYRNSSPAAVAPKKANAAAAKSPAAKPAALKGAEDKKELPAVAETAKPPVQLADTPQQQQMKYYVAARRDINSGRNQVEACNNAQRAYNYGRLPGSAASNVYAESGMLAARCLTGIPSYSSRFSNPKAQAQRILQNLAGNHNHAGAKHMLKQMK